MKIHNLLYIIGLILLITGINLIVYNPDSNRMYLIAGALFLLGFSLNIAEFLGKKA